MTSLLTFLYISAVFVLCALCGLNSWDMSTANLGQILAPMIGLIWIDLKP